MLLKTKLYFHPYHHGGFIRAIAGVGGVVEQMTKKGYDDGWIVLSYLATALGFMKWFVQILNWNGLDFDFPGLGTKNNNPS